MRIALIAAAALALAGSAHAQTPPPEPLSALAPANLHKPRPKPPFDLTGTWFVDLGPGQSFKFGPPYPKFTPQAQAEFDAGIQATKDGRAYHDYIGQCYPAGLPMIMTRVWPIAMVQLPTVIYMVSGFENAFREIYLDRPHMDPDVVVRSFNGESVGHWEGDALVVNTSAFISDHHTIDVGVPVSDQFHVVERIRLLNKGKSLEIAYTMTDPKMWEGEWKSTHRWKRVDDQDITEVECTPDLDQHLPATQSKLNIR